MPPSADRLMSSKKTPHSVGEMRWAGWLAAIVIRVGWALATSAPATSPTEIKILVSIGFIVKSSVTVVPHRRRHWPTMVSAPRRKIGERTQQNQKQFQTGRAPG